MSWSVHFIGAPDKVVAALEKHSTELTGASKEEYDTALPHLVGLVKQNISKTPTAIKVSAHNHAYGQGEDRYSTLSATIENIGYSLV